MLVYLYLPEFRVLHESLSFCPSQSALSYLIGLRNREYPSQRSQDIRLDSPADTRAEN